MRRSLLPLSLLPLTSALSSWYTSPGGVPAGSTPNDKIRGVNLGGWFILEPWMQPSLFQVSPLDTLEKGVVVDEWTYCDYLGREECESRLVEHWGNWIVEDDFKRMADLSLNTVRLPVPYWIWSNDSYASTEPYIVNSQLPFLRQALNLSSLYGLDVILDLHSLPGSQNGQDNSGRLLDNEEFSWNLTDNIARSLVALQAMTSEFTSDTYNGVVKAIELANEPYIEAYKAGSIPWDDLMTYYTAAYSTVRDSETILSGSHEVMIVIHDAFQSLSNYDYFNQTTAANWTNWAMDTHIYQAFSGDQTDDAVIANECYHASDIATSQAKWPTMTGEFALGTNTFCVDYQDCYNLTMDDALANITTDGDRDTFLREFWESQFHAYEQGAGWIFWNWKTELAPTWSYEQSVAQEWIPVDFTDLVYSFNASSTTDCLINFNSSNVPAYPSTAASIPVGTGTPAGTSLSTSSVVTQTTSSVSAASFTTFASVVASRPAAGTTSITNSTKDSTPTSAGLKDVHIPSQLSGAILVLISFAAVQLFSII